MTKQRDYLISRVVLAVLVLCSVAMAADPSARVARLRAITGQVSMQPGGVDDWVEAVVNRPLTASDRLWADKDSRVELTLGGAEIRIQNETSMTITGLDDNTMQVELDQGTLALHVNVLNSGEVYEIDTPNLAYTVYAPGDYRFDVDPSSDQTTVSVRSGDGEASGNGRSVRVQTGEQVFFDDGTSLRHETSSLPAPDGFDNWCSMLSRRDDDSPSLQYVSPGTVGYEDLDAYGDWVNYPQYGNVWIPRHVDRDWAPYHNGHWAWIEPWGWTWVDAAPWGFAPSHYGRWVRAGNRWAWSPGSREPHPVYAPALVAWVGGGSGFSAGVSIGGEPVGWVPLGYGEPYYPGYQASDRYVRNLNMSNARGISLDILVNNFTRLFHGNAPREHMHYANQGVPGGMTMVPRDVFIGARPVERAAMRVDVRNVENINVYIAAPVVPNRQSVLGSGALAGRGNRLPPDHRTVVTHMAPPPQAIRFENRQPLLQKNGGRPLDEQMEHQLRQQQPRPVVNGVQRNDNARPNNAPRPGQQQQNAQPYGRPNTQQPNTQPNGRPNTQQQPNTQPNGRPNTQQPNVKPNAQPTAPVTPQPNGRPSNQQLAQPTNAQPTVPAKTQPGSQLYVRPTPQQMTQPANAKPSAQQSAQPVTQPVSKPPVRVWSQQGSTENGTHQGTNTAPNVPQPVTRPPAVQPPTTTPHPAVAPQPTATRPASAPSHQPAAQSSGTAKPAAATPKPNKVPQPKATPETPKDDKK